MNNNLQRVLRSSAEVDKSPSLDSDNENILTTNVILSEKNNVKRIYITAPKRNAHNGMLLTQQPAPEVFKQAGQELRNETHTSSAQQVCECEQTELTGQNNELDRNDQK